MPRGFITKYRCYNFVNKNPVIDKVKTVLQDEGMFSKKKRAMLHQLSGVSVSTYDGWFEGDTKNPQHATIAATVAALGYEEQFIKTTKLDLDDELTKARQWAEKQKAARERFEAENAGGKRKRAAAAPKRAAAANKTAVKKG